MTNRHTDFIRIDEFLQVIKRLGITEKKAKGIIKISDTQFRNWKKKGRMPAERYWAFQQSVTIFLDEENLRKKVKLGIISRDFLKELLNECD